MAERLRLGHFFPFRASFAGIATTRPNDRRIPTTRRRSRGARATQPRAPRSLRVRRSRRQPRRECALSLPPEASRGQRLLRRAARARVRRAAARSPRHLPTRSSRPMARRSSPHPHRKPRHPRRVPSVVAHRRSLRRVRRRRRRLRRPPSLRPRGDPAHDVRVGALATRHGYRGGVRQRHVSLPHHKTHAREHVPRERRPGERHRRGVHGRPRRGRVAVRGWYIPDAAGQRRRRRRWRR